jgi:hypothetical protein
MERTFFYILATKDKDYFKVGMSNDPHQRMGNLQTGAQKKWYLYRQVSVATRNAARIIENLGKIRFRCYAEEINGEVYKVEKSIVDSFMYEILTRTNRLNPHWEMRPERV